MKIISIFNGINEAVNYRMMQHGCEHAAAIAAPFAAPEEVERYITACDKAKQQERRNDWLINGMSIGLPWLFLFGFNGTYGVITWAVFTGLWALFGINYLCVHKARIQAEAVVLATARLVNSVKIEGKPQ